MCYECAWPCCTHAIISWMPRCLLAIFPEPSHTWGHSLSWVLHFENWCRSFSHYRIKIIHTIHLAFIICCFDKISDIFRGSHLVCRLLENRLLCSCVLYFQDSSGFKYSAPLLHITYSNDLGVLALNKSLRWALHWLLPKAGSGWIRLLPLLIEGGNNVCSEIGLELETR